MAGRLLKNNHCALASMAQLVGMLFCKQKGLILSQGICLVVGSVPGQGTYKKQLIIISLSR